MSDGPGVSRSGSSRQMSARGGGGQGGSAPMGLADLLDRVLDKGLVIAGDIQINIADVELLTIKLRLLVASVDTARDMGINWWEKDTYLQGESGDGETERLKAENRELRQRLEALESGEGSRELTGDDDQDDSQGDREQNEEHTES